MVEFGKRDSQFKEQFPFTGFIVMILENLEDLRDNRGKIYLWLISFFLRYGVLVGFRDFTNMSYYLKKREAELSMESGFLEGVPSHDVFLDVFRVIDIEKFMALSMKTHRRQTVGTPYQILHCSGK